MESRLRIINFIHERLSMEDHCSHGEEVACTETDQQANSSREQDYTFHAWKLGVDAEDDSSRSTLRIVAPS